MTAPINHTGKTDIEYHSEKVAYNQEKCGICLHRFQQGNIISLLACNHIFHKDCATNLDKCPYDRSEISTPEEYPIPKGMDTVAFIQQLSSLDLHQAAAEYNNLVKRHIQDLDELLNKSDYMTANTYFSFRPPVEMEGHPRFPALLKRANEMFLGEKVGAYNRANCLKKKFYAYNATFGVEGVRVMELYENLDYSSPQLNQMRREYKRVNNLIKRTIAVSSIALLCYFTPFLSHR